MTNAPNSDLPDSRDLSGICTRCGDESTFTVGSQTTLHETTIYSTVGEIRPDERVTVLVCAKCQGNVAVIEEYGRRKYPEEPIDEGVSDEVAKRTPALQRAEVIWFGVQWWPLPD